MPLLFQQPVNTVEALVEKWPHLSHVIPSAAHLEAGVQVFRRNPKTKEIKVTPEEAREAAAFYNKLITDGRYVALAKENPAEAAKKLGVRISPAALEAVQAGFTVVGLESLNGDLKVAVTVVVCIVILVISPPGEEIVIDSSGIMKI